MDLLKCEQVTKQYGTGENAVTAVKELNLIVERGEFAAVMGASGSGKSTLLHMIGGVDRPDSGCIPPAKSGTDLSVL